MKAAGRSFASLGLHSIPIPFSPPSFTLLTRYVPASTGVHGRRLTSQRGVTPTHCGGVFVVLASWRAACAPRVWGTVIDCTPGLVMCSDVHNRVESHNARFLLAVLFVRYDRRS